MTFYSGDFVLNVNHPELFGKAGQIVVNIKV